MEKCGHKTCFIFVWARDSGAEVSSKNRQDRAGVMAFIQKKSSQATTTATVLQAKYTNSMQVYRTKPSVVNGIYSTRLYLITPCFHSVCIF